MPNPASLFRKAALDHLSSPEQLDQMLRVGSMRAWIGLLALLGAVTAALIWGFVGKVDTDVTGQGLIVRRGGVQSVVTLGAGEIDTLPVAVGQFIQAGTLIATIREPALADQIASAKTDIAGLEMQRAELQAMHRNGTSLQMSSYDEKKRSLDRDIGDLQAQDAELRARVALDEGLLAKGLITRQEKTGNEQKLAAIETSIQDRRAALSDLESQRFHAQSEDKPEDLQLAGRLATAQMQLDSLQHQLDLESSVRSPYSGRVIEVKTQPGSLVEAGQPILSLEPESGGLQVLVYVPADQAKQVLTGMAVQISPSQLRREEYGYIQGTVTAVTAYPSTQAALMDTFSNAPLVASLMATGPVVELQVAMVPDLGTPSGFRWSSPHGAAVVLTPGTIVASDVVVREQSPASLIVPYTRKKLGLR